MRSSIIKQYLRMITTMRLKLLTELDNITDRLPESVFWIWSIIYLRKINAENDFLKYPQEGQWFELILTVCLWPSLAYHAYYACPLKIFLSEWICTFLWEMLLIFSKTKQNKQKRINIHQQLNLECVIFIPLYPFWMKNSPKEILELYSSRDLLQRIAKSNYIPV